jgi:7-cyano-7-deazaguanine reductase
MDALLFPRVLQIRIREQRNRHCMVDLWAGIIALVVRSAAARPRGTTSVRMNIAGFTCFRSVVNCSRERMMIEEPGFTALGKNQTRFTGLDVFSKPENVVEVTLVGDELTAFCPITHQPDFYSYEVRYWPVASCIESKTFKLMIGSYRDQAAFAETLASDIAQQIHDATGARSEVTLTQQVRGGVSIIAKAAAPSSSGTP